MLHYLNKFKKILWNIKNFRFYSLRKKVNGMLSPAVYKYLFDLSYNMPEGQIIEIGGASGGGSIAIAWGMKESGKKTKLALRLNKI